MSSAQESPRFGMPFRHLSEALVDNSESAVIGIDLNGLIVFWNPGAEKLYGYSRQEAIGQEYRILSPDKQIGELRKVMDKVRHGRQLPAVSTKRRHKDGRIIDVRLSVHPVRDDEDRVIGMCTVAANISKLKEAERELQSSKAQIEAVVDTVLDGIVTISSEGIIDSVNPATERIFGYHAHELIGCNVNVLMPEPYHSAHDGYLENYLNTGQAKVIGIGREVRGKRKDGTEFPVDLAVTQMSINGKPAFVGILRDITARKEAEQELKNLTEQYKNKAEELANTLEQLRTTQDQLVRSEKLASLGELVAGVAHEINTPVGVCVTAASFLRDKTMTLVESAGESAKADDAIRQFLAQAEESTNILLNNLNRAAELIRSFKQVAVDRSNSELRRFVLEPFLNEVMNSLSPMIRKAGHNVSIECEGDQELQNYPGALSQVVTNLVQNALKHAFNPGEVGELRLRGKVGNEEVVLEFCDNGRGIPAAMHKKIFDPFFTTARNVGGTGLGLHVVHNLVTEALGGSISVESEEGEGCCFRIRIPRVKDSDTEAIMH